MLTLFPLIRGQSNFPLRFCKQTNAKNLEKNAKCEKINRNNFVALMLENTPLVTLFAGFYSISFFAVCVGFAL